MAQQREESLNRDQKITGTFKRAKSNINLWASTDNQTFKHSQRIRSIIKQKRETAKQFVVQKREIKLSNLNIENKREEINRLKDFITNERESLKARKYYFDNDTQLVKEFIDTVLKEQEIKRAQAEKQAAIKDQNKDQINSLQSQIEQIENIINRKREDEQQLQNYSRFINKLIENHQDLITEMNQKKVEKLLQNLEQNKKTPFVTEVGNGAPLKPRNIEEDEHFKQLNNAPIPFTAEELLDIINQIEEKNVDYVKAKQDAEDALDKLKAEEKILLKQYQTRIVRDHQQEITNLRKKIERLKSDKAKMQQQFLNNQQQQTSENSGRQELNMKEIGRKVEYIYRKIENENQTDLQPQTLQEMQSYTSSELKKHMTKFMKDLENEYDMMYQKDPNEIKNVERIIQNNQKEERHHAEQLAHAQKLQQNLLQKDQKRQLAEINRRRGRKIMQQEYSQSSNKNQVQVKVEDDIGDEIYMQEEYDLDKQDLNNKDKQ